MIRKNFGIIIESLIIAALIVAFSFWDPFSWFKSETKIKGTPVSLRSVKEIGQLVTAEYYGEAVASLKESMIEDYADTTIKYEANELFLNVMAGINILKEEDRDNKAKWFNLKGSIKQGNIARKFGERFEMYTENYLYFPLIKFLADTLTHSKLLRPAGETEEQVLWYLFTADDRTTNVFSNITRKNPGIIKNFTHHYHDYRTDSIRQEKIKKEIIYIGRGWVKAGIDFQDFNETKFWYDPKTKTIYFRKFEPKILDCDINPWYIPEKQVKGFELVVATGKIKEPFEDSRKVKLLCKEKLRKQALQSGILEQARANARLSIQRLFSLLMDEPVENVVFSSGKYQLLLQEIKADTLINETETQLLKSLFYRDSRVLDTAWYTSFKLQINDLKEFCNDLKNLHFDLSGKPYNFFSAKFSEFYKDGILKDDDVKKLSAMNAAHTQNIGRFELKVKLFRLYLELSPEFKPVFELLHKDPLAQNYLQLSPDLFSVKNVTQYRLSNSLKKDFLTIVDEKLNASLTKDPDFDALFWFDTPAGYTSALTAFNIEVFDAATLSELTQGTTSFVIPSQNPDFVNQLTSVLQKRSILLSFSQ